MTAIFFNCPGYGLNYFRITDRISSATIITKTAIIKSFIEPPTVNSQRNAHASYTYFFYGFQGKEGNKFKNIRCDALSPFRIVLRLRWLLLKNYFNASSEREAKEKC